MLSSQETAESEPTFVPWQEGSEQQQQSDAAAKSSTGPEVSQQHSAAAKALEDEVAALRQQLSAAEAAHTAELEALRQQHAEEAKAREAEVAGLQEQLAAALAAGSTLSTNSERLTVELELVQRHLEQQREMLVVVQVRILLNHIAGPAVSTTHLPIAHSRHTSRALDAGV